MPGGRPTKYIDAYPELLLEYFGENIDFEDKKHPFYQEGWKKETFPTKAGFAVYIGVAKDTLNEWANAKINDEEGKVLGHKYPEFSVAYKRVVDFQEKNLISGAFDNELNMTFSIFFAKNNLGYKDRTENESKHTGTVEVVHTAGSQKAREAIDNLTGNTGED